MVDFSTNATAALLCWSFTPSDRRTRTHPPPRRRLIARGGKADAAVAAAAAAENNNSFALLAYVRWFSDLMTAECSKIYDILGGTFLCTIYSGIISH